MCNKCNQQSCNCNISQFPIVCDPCLKNKYCTEKMDADCVFYHLDDPTQISKLLCTGIPSNTSLSIILEEFDKRLCGLTSSFGIIGQDTNTVDITVTNIGNIFTVKNDLKYVDSNSIDFSDSALGFTGELKIDPLSNLPVSIGPAGVLLNSCKQIGDFKEVVGTNVIFAGNGIIGSFYELSIYKVGVGFVGTVSLNTEIALDATHSNIIFNCSAFSSSFTQGSVLEFRARTKCGTKTSGVASKFYTVPSPCPQLTFDFNFTNIINDTIVINNLGATPNSLILHAEYQLTVNGADAGSGIVILNGTASTSIKSLIPLTNGATVAIKFKSYCDCCNGVLSTSGFGTPISHVITVINTNWIDVPSIAFKNNWVSCTTTGTLLLARLDSGKAQYKVKDGILEFRGTIIKPYSTSYPMYPPGTNAGVRSLGNSYGIEDVIDCTVLTNYISNSYFANYGVKISNNEINGVHSYSSIVKTDRNWTDAHLFLTFGFNTLSVSVVSHTDWDDPGQTGATNMVPNQAAPFIISLENTKVYMI